MRRARLRSGAAEEVAAVGNRPSRQEQRPVRAPLPKASMRALELDRSRRPRLQLAHAARARSDPPSMSTTSVEVDRRRSSRYGMSSQRSSSNSSSTCLGSGVPTMPMTTIWASTSSGAAPSGSQRPRCPDRRCSRARTAVVEEGPAIVGRDTTVTRLTVAHSDVPARPARCTAAEAMDCGDCPDQHHLIQGADVDPQLERAGGDDRPQALRPSASARRGCRISAGDSEPWCAHAMRPDPRPQVDQAASASRTGSATVHEDQSRTVPPESAP